MWPQNQQSYATRRLYKWCAQDNCKCGGSEVEEMLPNYSGVKKQAEIQQGWRGEEHKVEMD